MSNQIETSLSSLLPTLSPLPSPLLDLAKSLLAQSRSKASSLKAEEEIGRTYACCHIACERLAKNLALDITKPTPPCAPRVYGKLKTYLGTVLKTAANTTPRTTRTEDKLDNAAGKPEARTPGSGREGLRRTPVKRTLTVEDTPSKRRKCTPVAAPPPSQAAPGPEPEPKTTEDPRIPYAPNEEEEGDDNNDRTPIKRPSKTPLRRKEKHASRPIDNTPEDLGPAGLLPGLGTMFQPAVDWLSEERRIGYRVWEKEIYQRMAVVEQVGG
ncbi:hypothetical protein LTR62_006959 [Meristemomyces frigidus]|uniref:ORC6 first cyclin-like domain-containing protein n=1 Tax=Meristemomyces frigidus TaxID=1508187 RepID=A0AAN7YI84_9PEZI|nr:hypothetical protein LTR62_006959 [Meristemomyces frigidus]